MKRAIYLSIAMFFLGALVFTGCKKADTGSVTDYSNELSTHSTDQARFSEEMDVVDDEAAALLEDNTIAFDGFVNGVDTVQMPCGMNISRDTSNGLKRILIHYNGQNCNGRIRSGDVILSMPLAQRWRDTGAVLTVTIQNLQIIRLLDTTTFTVNGLKTFTNVTGGRLSDLATLGTIIHDVSSTGMSITFDNGTTRNWQIALRRTFTYNNGIIITTTGLHTDGTTTGICMWGTNRFGNSFVTSISAPLVHTQDCNFRLVSGQVSHQRMAANVVVTFGLDATGNPTSCPGMAPFYMKIVFTSASGAVWTAIRPY